MNIDDNPFTSHGREILLNEIADIFEEKIAQDSDSYVNIVEARDHFETMLRFLRERLGAQVVSLVFLEPRTQAFEAIFSAGSDRDFEEWWKKVGTGAGIVRDAVVAGHAIWTPDVSAHPSFVKIANADIVSQLTLLLRDHGIPCAVVAIEWDRKLDDTNAIVGDRDEFAKRLGMLILSFRARVFAQRSQRAFEEVQKIAEMETLEARVQRVLHAVRQLTGGGEVAVLRRIGAKLEVFETVDLDKDNVPEPIGILAEKSNGYVAEVAVARSAFYCDNTADESRFPLYRRVDQRTQCQLSVPLIFRRELVGVLNVGSKRPYAFNYMTRGLLAQFAAHTASILYNTAVLDGIRAIYDHVRKHLSYLSIMAPSVQLQLDTGNDLSFGDRVERVRESVNDVWAGLSPLQRLSHSASPTTIVGSKLRETVVNRLKAQMPPLEVKVVQDRLKERSIHCALEETEAACESATRSVLLAILPNPYTIQATLTISQYDYDRRERHGQVLSVGTDPVRVSYLMVVLELRVSSPHIEAISRGNLVNPSLSSLGNPFQRVRDMGVNLWACDRVLAAAGGFIGAEKTGDDQLRLSFWLLEDSPPESATDSAAEKPGE